ncbi:MarR family transcriptional regulator [Phycicoccus sp. MAQZ13P-2]|nr:MarR family transcriptional regulator [Phycicoccus mangrovi]
MADGAPPLVLDQVGGNVALDLFIVTERVGSLLSAALAGTEVSPSQYAVYSQLMQAPRTPSELSELLGIPRSTLSGYLATMLRRGDVTRKRSLDDGRSWLISLSPAGRVRTQECSPRIQRAIRALNSHLGSAAEVLIVRQTLGRIDGAVRAATSSA